MRGETTGTLNYAFDRASMRLKRKKYDKTVTECLIRTTAASARKPVLLYTTLVYTILQRREG